MAGIIVMPKLAFDSCFLIDYERERAGRKLSRNSSPLSFLSNLETTALAISPVALAEFAIGFSTFTHPVLQVVLSNFELLSSSIQVSFSYSRIYLELRSNNNIIGTNDIWIAAYSLAYDLPLVTNNIKEFSRISGLKVLGY